MKKTIVIVGAGKGCGNHVADVFGSHDFRVVLMARNADHLAGYATELAAKGIEVATEVADASDFASVTRAFAAVKEKFGMPDVLVYNVGITSPDAAIAGGMTADILVDRYRTDVAGAYHAIKQVLGEEFSQKHGAILITGGGFGIYPMADFLPLSLDKAALRAMCLALHEALKKENIYVGTMTVTDSIVPGGRCDPHIVAEDFWRLYQQREACEFVR